MYPFATLNKTATAIFQHIISLPRNAGSGDYMYWKLHNSEISCYMDLVVEKLGSCSLMGKIWDSYSFAHYYKQNGDSMRDPEMCFLYNEELKEVIPYMFCMDGIFSRYEESIQIGDETYSPRLQKAHTAFANKWMKNINEQQELGVKIPRAKVTA